MNARKRVLFYVQHLLGIGHLRRAATIVRALDDAGLDVTLVSGGHEIPGVNIGGARLIQLPATRATDLYFKDLVDESGAPIDAAWKAGRARKLLDIWRETEPHVLMFELFPFGRRQMRFELLPLLDEATAAPRRPAVVSSVRDILVAQNKPGRNDEMLALVQRYFDHVLIHGDPSLIGLGETFPHAARIDDKVHYTGYVVDETGERGDGTGPGAGEVIVSSGGGAVGEKLLRTAMEARAHTNARNRTWRVLVGFAVGESDFRVLADSAPDGVIVERARGDFPTLLMNAALSISQGGYNTVMEVLRAGCRAIVVPYAGGLETEQTLRARLLAERGVLNIIDESALTPKSLAQAVDRALSGPPAEAGIDSTGAKTTADLIRKWADEIAW